MNNIVTREAIITCDFPEGILDGVDPSEELQSKAFILRNMSKDYELFNTQLGILSKDENEFFNAILKGKRI